MFKSAVIRLTIGYVAAIALICLMFSIPVYSLTSNRLRSGAERQGEFIRRVYRQGQPVISIPELVEIREEQLSKDRSQLLTSLVIINLGIIAIGGYLSYLFARQTLKPIQEAHKLQQEFTANASHELRTPLAIIQSQSEIALRSKDLKLASAKDTLNSNLEEVSRLQDITNQLLSLTKLGSSRDNFKSVDLVKVIKAEVNAYRKSSKAKIESDLVKTAVVLGDTTLLRQVISILLDNAIKYSRPEEEAKISIKLQKNKHDYKIMVSDNGIGISAQDRDLVFDRFYRGKNVNKAGDKIKGSGLGLAIAQQIVEKHKGEIGLESRKGSRLGASFLIKLPALEENAQ